MFLADPHETMFAKRTQWNLTPNALTKRLKSLRKEGVSILDLTVSNPTLVGIEYPRELLVPLSDSSNLTYDPNPKGFLPARQAVAHLYSSKGISLSPEQIFLTASTSEAYGFLFQLLCNPGDKVLVPRPSYPLFEYLTGINDVEPIFYRLGYPEPSSRKSLSSGDRWRIDFESLESVLSSEQGLPSRGGSFSGMKAVVAVHPNNPTGSSLTGEELETLLSICQENRLALIADEVFAEYRFGPQDHSPDKVQGQKDLAIPATLLGSPDVLTFSLGGLSKFLALPQMKLSWIAATGPSSLLSSALERLEMIADTVLSVNTPVQHSLPTWLKFATSIQGQISRRLTLNRKFLEATLSLAKAECLNADGGWSAVLKIPSLRDEEAFVVELLAKAHTLVHPGYFFDFEEPGYCVVSLLPEEKIFQEGVTRLLQRSLSSHP